MIGVFVMGRSRMDPLGRLAHFVSYRDPDLAPSAMIQVIRSQHEDRLSGLMAVAWWREYDKQWYGSELLTPVDVCIDCLLETVRRPRQPW